MEIPAELIGHEASCRLLAPLFLGAARKGLPLEPLAEGTGYPLEHLRDAKRRVAWAAYQQVLSNLARSLSDDEIVAVGASFLDQPLHRAYVLPYRLRFTLAETYRRGVRPDSALSRQILVQDMMVVSSSDRRIVIEVRFKPGYACVREYWLLRKGFIESVPRAFGLPSARATYTGTDTFARFDIALPEDETLFGKLRQRSSWVFAAKDAAAALRQANDELLDRNTELEREIEARKAAEDQLRALNGALEQRIQERTSALEHANAELSMFSTSIAHDLRTPLRAINGFATTVLLDHGERIGAEGKDSLERIMTGAVRMGELIDALLSLGKISRTEMRREPVDLGRIARDVIEQLRAIEPARNVELQLAGDLVANGNPPLVRALLENLLGNAWKFTKERAPARIELRAVDGLRGVFCVRDDGVGFDMKHADRIFEPFARLAPKSYDGTGVGLATVDRIVKRHGGKVWVASAPGNGAAFWFSLG